MSDLWRIPVTLEGRLARLEPTTEAHIPGLTEAAQDAGIWQYMLMGSLQSEADTSRWIRDLLAGQERGTDKPFTVIHLASGRVAGATRYLEMHPEHRTLEIGGTWYAPEFQRTGVNTECKYLLLKYAFETLKAIRVQFKTDSRNARSIRAVERIGAVREGVLRNHYIMPDGFIRDSVYFSIIDCEWPEVKAKLESMLVSNGQKRS